MDDPCDDWTQSLANLRRSEPAQTPAPPCPALPLPRAKGQALPLLRRAPKGAEPLAYAWPLARANM